MFVESGALTVGISVILLPFFFAISHLHHVFDQKRRQDKAAKEQAKDKVDTTMYAEYISYKKAIVVSLFRIAYTQIFGIYSGLVYANTGSLWPAFVLHAQCNFFGFPTFDNLMNQDIRRTERILILLLYVIGVIIIFTCFNWFT